MSFICAECVGEPYLQRLVQDAATSENPCEYCDGDACAADLWEVAQLCGEVIDTFFEESSNTMAVIHFNRTPAGNDLQTTISELTGMPQEAVEPLGHAWREMEENLRSDVRYFNPKALTLLHTIFGELINDRDKDGQPVVFEAGPGTSLKMLFRGRQCAIS